MRTNAYLESDIQLLPVPKFFLNIEGIANEVAHTMFAVSKIDETVVLDLKLI